MFKKHSFLYRNIFLIADILALTLAWWAAYLLRRYDLPLPLILDMRWESYAKIFPIVLLICLVTYRRFRLYVPRRDGAWLPELRDILKASTAAMFILVTATFFYSSNEYSRLVLANFYVLNTGLLIALRVTGRRILRTLHVSGVDVKRALVVGSGRLGQKVEETVRRNTWSGIEIVGFLDRTGRKAGQKVHGLPVLGGIPDLARVIKERTIDQVFVALPFEFFPEVARIIHALARETVDVRLVPDLYRFRTLNRSLADFDGLPVLALRESPLYGWGRLLKRLTDVVFSALFLAAISPLLALIVLLIKVTSPGPACYRQRRMGLDGRVFDTLKFRSMRVDAEKGTGAVWAKENDPRRTGFGSFLRRTSLDELPQFVNVLKGEMSIVGPRPERPEFIEEFRRSLPGYMLRHKMKAGITGWAQVCGWRGNTSLRKRIQYDLYYIENWSWGFDLKIMLLTAIRGLVNKHAY